MRRIKRQYQIVRYVLYRQTALKLADQLWTFIGTFSAIASIGLLEEVGFPQRDGLFLIGSFGASSMLLFGMNGSHLARPRNLVGGHLLASLIGVAIHKSLPDYLWLSSALAVSLSILVMQITRTMHPPGAATALIANIGSEKITGLGFSYTIAPVMTGVLILLCIAVIIDSLRGKRSLTGKVKQTLITPLSRSTGYTPQWAKAISDPAELQAPQSSTESN